MSTALLGLLTALGWGCADFIARFTGRALGHRSALLGMLATSAVVLTAVFWLSATPVVLVLHGWWSLLLTGLGLMTATLLLYDALARGPVTVVSPIVGGYPAFSLIFAVLLGVRPAWGQWLAMALTMTGVAIVAGSASHFADREHSRAQLRATVAIALLSSFGFAVTIAAGQAAAAVYGEFQTVMLARWVGVAASAALLGWHRIPPRLSLRWLGLLALQGLLDVSAYLALLAAGRGPGAEIAVVIGSGFCAVTVLLARLIIKEPMTLWQWCGIGLIVAGVAMLSGYA